MEQWTKDYKKAMKERGKALNVFEVQEAREKTQAEMRETLISNLETSANVHASVKWITTGLAIKKEQYAIFT